MSDRIIRSVVLEALKERHRAEDGTVVIQELGLRHGLARVDVAVIGRILHGYELKGSQDDLRRLGRQASVYSAVLDRVTAVIEETHLRGVLRMVPDWWGIDLLVPDFAGLQSTIMECRRPRDNPSVDKQALVKLLWRAEALAFLEKLGAADGIRSKPRITLYRRIADVASHDLIRAEVRDRLTSRQDWRSVETP